MKAAFYMFLFALLGLQISCATNPGPTTSPVSKAPGAVSALETPEVAVMPMKHAVLVAWRPIAEADGYFVYRETKDPPVKKMLGIGPKEAQGFLDREPAGTEAQYSVQAFKVSDISDKKESKALGGATTMPSQSPAKQVKGRALQVAAEF